MSTGCKVDFFLEETTKMTHFFRLIAAALATLAMLSSGGVQAQPAAWPSKPVRFIVPFTPGGGTDIATRLVAERLSRMWGQPVIVENKPGGSSIIGTDYVVRSAPDGHTLLAAVPVTVQNVALRKNLPYDTIKDLVPVTELNRQQYAVIARSTFETNTLAEILAQGKTAKTPLLFASSGIGSTGHIAAEKIRLDRAMEMTHVPYKGSPELVRAIVSAEADLGLVDLQTALPFAKVGRLKIVAFTGPRRLALFPTVPTLAESGIKGFEAYNWVGYFAPRGTPADIVQKISDDINQVQSDPAITRRMENDLAVEPTRTTPAEFRQVFEQDLNTWTSVIKAVGITLD